MPEINAPDQLAGQPVGRRLKIVGFALAADVQQRLLEMGLTAGTECTVLRYAPLGDPLELKVRGYCLSLRLALRLASPEAKIASSKTRSYFCTDPYPTRSRHCRTTSASFVAS